MLNPTIKKLVIIDAEEVTNLLGDESRQVIYNFFEEHDNIDEIWDSSILEALIEYLEENLSDTRLVDDLELILDEHPKAVFSIEWSSW